MVIAATVLLAGALGAVLLDPGADGTPDRSGARPAEVPEVTRTPLLPADSDQAATPSDRGLRRALQRALANPLLVRVGLSVVDVQTGQPLIELQGGRPVVPASTVKLLTAMAALTVLPSDQQFVTRVVAGTGADVVLVGGGDPTLRGPKSKGGGARLAELAAQLKQRGGPVGRVVVDDSLFTGPRLGPGWKAGYVSAGDVSPVSALELADTESLDPAMDAGRELAAMIGATSVVRGTAAVGAAELARVSSAAVPDLVERMLTNSDNDLAEALGRHVAIAAALPATFAGEAAATAAALEPLLSGLGVPGSALSLRDTSGLSPLDRVQPLALARLLALAARDERFGALLSGLPVAGFDGTLQGRYRKGPTAVAAGQVRAKTGTLTGVSALAGLVRTREGRLLSFDITADAVPEVGSAKVPAALDAVATALAGCGCS